MKRLRRILRNTFAFLSLFLAAAILILWIRSYFTGDFILTEDFNDFAGQTFWGQNVFRIGKGGLGLNRIIQSRPVGLYANLKNWSSPRHRSVPPAYPDFNMASNQTTHWGFRFDGFARGWVVNRPRAESWEILIPFWSLFLFALLAGIPFWLSWFFQRPDQINGFCPKCGYDLRATPNQCPECGQTTTKSVQQTSPR